MSPARIRNKSRGDRIRLILIIAAVVVGVILFAGSKHWLSVESLREHRDALMQYVDGRYWESLFVLAALSIVLVGISMPVSPVLMLLSGMLFSRWLGGFMILLSAAVGATLAMLIVRHLAYDFVKARVHRHPRARRMMGTFRQHQDSYLLFLRVAPGFPFWLTNILYGLTEIAALRFLLLTLLGMVPDVAIYSNVGANLAHVKSAHDILSPGTIVALALLALLCLLPVVIQQLQRRGWRPHGWPFGSRTK